MVRFFLALGLLSGFAVAQTTSPTTAATPYVDKHPNVVDLTDMIDSTETWSDGTLHNANVFRDDPPRVVMGYFEKKFPKVGTWVGPEVKTEMPFTEMIASFNVNTPGKTGAVLDIRVKVDGEWSPWLYFQSWGKTLTPPTRPVEFSAGKMDIDTLVLNKPAKEYQARVTLQSFEFHPEVRPFIRRLAIVYSGDVTDPEERARLRDDQLERLHEPATMPTSWARDLAVPFRGQGDYKNPRPLWSLICSPTSTSMVLQYFGANFTTQENAEAIFDPNYDMFGNWGRAVSRAGELGFDAWLERFRNWDQVKRRIAEGTPVIASIRFKKGEVQGFLYKDTDGHLIVIRGMTPEGDLIVNDPAAAGEAHRDLPR